MTLSLIIPAYNEEERLAPFLKTIVDYHAKHPEDITEILLVDDGSKDNTIKVAESFNTKLPIRVVKHEVNKGKGGAVKTGVDAATSDLIVFTDADGATPITELPKMIAALKDSDIGVGNRWMPGAETDRHSFLRQLSGWSYRNYMKLFGLGKIDTMCGFKGYRSDVAKKLFSNLIDERWLFDTEIAYKSVKAKYKTNNFPIEWESKDGSKLPTSTLIKSAFQIWPLITRINKQKSSQ